MRGLDRGEEFIVTRNGVPVGELVPFRKPGFVPTSRLIEAVRGTGRIDSAQFRADLDDVFGDEFVPPG